MHLLNASFTMYSVQHIFTEHVVGTYYTHSKHTAHEAKRGSITDSGRLSACGLLASAYMLCRISRS